MNKIILVFAALTVCFALLLPFASTTPDGLETLSENHADQQQPYWNGIMADYSMALGSPYLSTLVAGLLGLGLVVGASFALSLTMHKKKTHPA